MAERDTINDNHVPSRPGWIVYIGLVVVVVGIVAIMLENKLCSTGGQGRLGASQQRYPYGLRSSPTE